MKLGKFLKLRKPATLYIPLDESPLAVLIRDRSGDQLREEVMRAGLSALSHTMVRRARLLALTAHATVGNAVIMEFLSMTAGFLALARADTALIAAGWCHQVLQDTTLPDLVVGHEVSYATRDLVARGVVPCNIGSIVSPAEQTLALAIMAAGLLHALQTGQKDTQVLDCSHELNRSITPFSSAARHLLVLNREMAGHLARAPDQRHGHHKSSYPTA